MSQVLQYSIRPAAVDDFEIVFAIKKNGLGPYIEQTWGWDEEFQRKMQKEEFDSENISIIEVDGKPIGTLGINEKENEIRISRLYIIDEYQSKGIGSKIVNDIIGRYSNSLKPIKLGVLVVNKRAKELYEKLGFEVYGQENHHFQMVYNPINIEKWRVKGKICKNCGAIAEDKFCPKCGQKTSIHRYTFKQILHDFFHSFTHVDSGILYLIKELSIRPGTVAREYIQGKRKKYFSPMQYLIIGVAVVTFLSINLNIGINLLGGGNISFTGKDPENFRIQFISFLYKYYNIFQFITVPITSFFSLLFFRKSGVNYAENLILNTFLIGHRHFVFLLFIPFLYIFNEVSPRLVSVHFIIWSIYFVYAYIQFFKPKGKVWAVIKSLFIIFLFMLIQIFIMVIIFYSIFYKKAV